jgi:crossover junction endodeoxyribonuclease RusA
VPESQSERKTAGMPHLEFTVDGPPVSHQTKDKANLSAWKEIIRTEAARLWIGKSPLTGKLKCTIYNFHEGERASLDDDNMVKPIRDALNRLIYDDDSQIRYSETIHISIDAPIKIRRASAVLLAAYSKGDEFLYIRIDDAPDFIQLPQ